MFSRRPDRSKEDPRLAPDAAQAAPAAAATGSSGAPMGPPLPSQGDPQLVAASRGDATVIGPRDRIEGTIRSTQGVLVLGAHRGTIESESWIRIAQGGGVIADLTAQEVVVAGRAEGSIAARERCEIGPEGQVTGDVRAPRLVLHEGGAIDGGLWMTRTDVPPPMRPATSAAGSATGGAGTGRSAPARIPVVALAPGAPAPALPARSSAATASIRGSGPATARHQAPPEPPPARSADRGREPGSPAGG